MKNSINVFKEKIEIKDHITRFDSNISYKAADKKAIKILTEIISPLVYDRLNNYIKESGYIDMRHNDISIKLKSSIESGMFFDYEIYINNEHVNVYDKQAILENLYRESAFIEYDETFIKQVRRGIAKRMEDVA